MAERLFGKIPAETAYLTGAFVALGAALLVALGIRPVDFSSDDAVAVVNGYPVPASEYARALSAMQAGLSRSLTPEDRQRALDILIDEELIVQRALELDMARTDRMSRKRLVQAMILSALVLEEPLTPADEELQVLFEAEPGLFATPAFVTVQIAGAADAAQAENFRTAIAEGGSFLEASALNELEDLSPPPQLPLGKLSDYLGSAGLDALRQMRAGDIAGPFPYAGRQVFVWLQAVEGGDTTDFESARDIVKAEWLRRQEEQAFKDYVARLRQGARIDTLIDPAEDPA